MEASINSIESFSTIDGPGIRTVIFFNGCTLRCKYCHNPEMWSYLPKNASVEEIYKKVLRNANYFGKSGGVTYSGGEPLLQSKFLTELSKKLKESNINIALDTAGISKTNYEELLQYVDIIIFDIKDITETRYKNLTSGDIHESIEFIKKANELNKKFIIRQVLVPGIHDTLEFIDELNEYIKRHFKKENILSIEFIPYHHLGKEKYKSLGINYPLNCEEMSQQKCEKLYKYFQSIY